MYTRNKVRQIYDEVQGYKTKLKSYEEDLKSLTPKVAKAEANIPGLKKRIEEGEEELAKARIESLVFADHAILRYLERFEGLNLEEVKNRMLSDSDKQRLLEYGKKSSPYLDGQFLTESGLTLTIREGVIKTIWKTEDESPNKGASMKTALKEAGLL
ncbi:MAG: hypothetical protein KDH96_01950 [Candidatus Riesia sp.]|nr:hypothetical protein [Candidatus Riesia sp.]